MAKISRYSLNQHGGLEPATMDEDQDGDFILNEDLLKVRDVLMNLLCVVHKDGGQYAREHGLKKATDDAINIIAFERLNKSLDKPKEGTAI